MAADGIPRRTGNDEVDRLLSRVSEQVEQLEKTREEFTEMRGEGEAAEGMVKVSVRPGGAIDTININPRAMRLGSEALAEAITEAAHAAEKNVTERMTEIMQPLIGDTTAFNDILKGKLPGLEGYSAMQSEPRLNAALQKLEELRKRGTEK